MLELVLEFWAAGVLALPPMGGAGRAAAGAIVKPRPGCGRTGVGNDSWAGRGSDPEDEPTLLEESEPEVT